MPIVVGALGTLPSGFEKGLKELKIRMVCFGLVLSYLPTPPLEQDITQGHFFKRSLTGLNSEFSFS